MTDDMPARDRPISEEFRLVAKKWAAADHRARLLDEMKTPELERRKNELIEAAPADEKMTDAKAERIIKASEDWREYITEMVQARSDANILAKQLAHIEIRKWEIGEANANRRAEMRL